MIGYANNLRFYLISNEINDGVLTEIPTIKGYSVGNKDVISRDKKFYFFQTKKNGKVELFDNAYDYLLEANTLYGINIDIRLITKIKDDMTTEETLKTVSNVGIDMKTLDFDDNMRTVGIETVSGGILDVIKSRWSDKYDIIPNKDINENVIPALNTVNLRLEPRQILRRSRLFVEDGTVISHPVGGGDILSARAIPFQVDYNSDKENINKALGNQLSAASGTYADLSADKRTNLLYLIADRDRTIRLNGKVKTTQSGTPHFGSFTLDVILYENGDSFNFKEIFEQLNTADPDVTGAVAEYVFSDYEITLLEGESMAISTLASLDDGIQYTITDTEIIITEDDTYPQTYTKAITFNAAYKRVIEIITGQPSFTAPIYEEGGKYGAYLLVHGTWARNMPEILNVGEDDEKNVQAKLSLKELFEVGGAIEPLRYDSKLVGLSDLFEVGTELETQQNFTSIRLGETRNGKFELIPVITKRKVIGENYWGSINIGSEKSGEEYGEVNNLYSMCGNALWNTINKLSDSEYKALTKFRTGSEGLELTRQVQYEDNPDKDTERDNDWFVVEAKKVGNEYHLVKWDDLYETIPNGYSSETNYNWSLTPARLYDNHSWKLKQGLSQGVYANDSVKFVSSNCNSNITTKKAGEDSVTENAPIPHKVMDSATVDLKTVEFELPMNQEIWDMLNGTTNGIDNKFGLIQYQTDKGIQIGRLIKVDTNGKGKWTLIEAKL